MCRLRSLPATIVDIQRDLSSSFDLYFKSLGYSQAVPEGIIPSQDDTLLFTNATIVPLKQYVISGQVHFPGFFLQQKCLRVHNLQNVTNDSFNPPYMSYFKMPGILVHPSRYLSMVKEIWGYLVGVVDIPGHDIKIWSSSTHKSLVAPWQNLCDGPSINFDSRPQDCYSWTYGMRDITGTGFTFAVRQEREYFECVGDLVAIHKDHVIVAYEFGIGLETMIARKFKLRSPFEASLISTVIPFDANHITKKLQDCVALATVLYRNSIRPGHGGRRDILRRVLKALRYLVQRLDIDYRQICRYVHDFEWVEFGNNAGIAEQLKEDLLKYDEDESRKLMCFKDYVVNQRRLYDQGRFPNIRSLIALIARKARNKYGLKEQLYQEIVHRYFHDLLQE